jgi:hypothetical protein
LGAALHDCAAIILWTGLAIIPAEIVFDAIEAELERCGV